MRVGLLAEQNFNLIDGSTIWLLNACKLLARQPDMEVALLLSHPLTDDVLAREVPPEVAVLDMAARAGSADRLGPEALPAALAAAEAGGRLHRLLVRGAPFVEALLADAAWAGRVVAYAPDVVARADAPEPRWIAAGRAARMPVVVQSATAKAALESLSDYPAHAVHVVPPIVLAPPAPAREPGTGATICYSGKIDPEYGLDWLIDLVEAPGRPEGLRVQWIAGKDTWRSRHPAFFRRMDALRAHVAEGRCPGVAVASGLPHAEALALMGWSDLAFCLRRPLYDDSIEISTKIVEFCALGVPPILNDTGLNRDLFGADYPYLLDPHLLDGAAPGLSARLAGLAAGVGGPVHARARARVAEVAEGFSAERLSDRLAAALRGRPRGAAPLADRPRRLLVATHDAKFLHLVAGRLRAEPLVELAWERWASTTRAGTPTRPAEPPDTVLCEWACENAVWHSRNKRPGTRLIVRLHRFEAFRDFPSRIAWDAVDALIVVSDHFRDLVVERHGVDPARVHVHPQPIDWRNLQRPKTPHARLTLGLVGINPFDHKRFDRALDVVARLRAEDARFNLAVRSVMPWEIDWVWKDPAPRARFEAAFERVARDPLLRGAVRFDPAGPDMEEWYRGIGTILSSSDSEGCHTSVMEAIASGCHAAVHDWPGARGLFGAQVHADMADAIPGILAFADAPDIEARREAQSRSMLPHDVEPFARALLRL